MNTFKHFRVVEKKKDDGSLYYEIEYKKHRFFSYWRKASIPFKGINEWKDEQVYTNTYIKFYDVDDAKLCCNLLNKYYKVICDGFSIFPVFTYNSIYAAFYGYCVTAYRPCYDSESLYIHDNTTDFLICKTEEEIKDTVDKAIDIRYNKQYSKVIE